MNPFNPDTILHVLSRCDACQIGQVGTRVCVEKGHMATVASVKRSQSGVNFVDPYTEDEVDARYRLMLKPNEPFSVLSADAVIDGVMKFAPGTIFQQPQNTKSQTLLGCFKNGVPLDDFVLGGGTSRRSEAGGDERQAKRKAPSPATPSSSKKSAIGTPAVKKEPPTLSEKAASMGISGLTAPQLSQLGQMPIVKADEEDALGGRNAKRQGTRSNTTSGAGTGTSNGGGGAEEAGAGTAPPAVGNSASQLEELSAAEAELKRSYDAHMKFLAEAEEAKKAEVEAFQRQAARALENIERSRRATKDDGFRQRKLFLEQRQRITRLRMQEVDAERARNQVESEKREAKLKAEKEALSRACEKEATDLGNAWAAVAEAAGRPSDPDGKRAVGGGDADQVGTEAATVSTSKIEAEAHKQLETGTGE